MRLSVVSLICIGLLNSSVLAGSEGRGNNPSNAPDATCNTVPTKRRLKSREVSRAQGFQLEKTTPLAPEGRIDGLFKRSGSFVIDNSCNAPPPTGSKWGSGFPSMTSIINQAFADAMTLAIRMQNVPRDHPAYLHYFSSGFDEQYTNLQNIMRVISSGDNAYSIKFVCNFGSPCTTRSVAVTDATIATSPGDQKTIQLCGPFFTSKSTQDFLFEASKGQNPGVPFRDNTVTGWCDKSQNANFFSTVGHTLLHELTHLDAIANAAGYSADDDGYHGTLDAQDENECELLGARDYLTTWGNDDTGVVPSPDYNAESLAASATEFYFSEICSFEEIPPKSLSIANPAPSSPTCGPYETSLENAQAINADLDSRGGFQCCSSGDGGCDNISTAGGESADLCTDPTNKSVLCVDCALVANYLDGMIAACAQNGQVGGSQAIVEAPGLTLEI